MPAQSRPITLAEFHTVYKDQKPAFEYWGGEVVRKSMPTSLHGLLQYLLMRLLGDAGWIPASEVRLKVAPDYEPVPDIIASRTRLPQPYPTTAPELCIEILSKDDQIIYLLDKANHYLAWGAVTVWIVDPIARAAWTITAAGTQTKVTLEESLTAGETSIGLRTLFDLVDHFLDPERSAS